MASGSEAHRRVSGRELVAKGFPEDVDLAAALDVSEVVPLHDAGDGFFRPAATSWLPPPWPVG